MCSIDAGYAGLVSSLWIHREMGFNEASLKNNKGLKMESQGTDFIRWKDPLYCWALDGEKTISIHDE